MDIYRGVIPFVGIQLLALLLIAAWPELATALPDRFQVACSKRISHPMATGPRRPFRAQAPGREA